MWGVGRGLGGQSGFEPKTLSMYLKKEKEKKKSKKKIKTRKSALRGTYTPGLVSFLKYKHILKILDLPPLPYLSNEL